MPETASKYHNQSIGALELQINSLRQLAEVNKKEQAEIMAEVERRLAPGLTDELRSKGKEVGSLTKDLADGVKVKAEVKQTVKWDGDQLQTIASALTWDQIKHYFKITFSVPEKIYGALDPTTALHKALTKARTTEKGDLKISFVPRKD